MRALSDESAAPHDARLIERLEACCHAAEAGSCVPTEVKPTGISAEPGAPAETGDADDFDALFAMLEAPVAEDAPAGETFAPDDLFDQAAAAIESVGEAANVSDRYLLVEARGVPLQAGEDPLLLIRELVSEGAEIVDIGLSRAELSSVDARVGHMAWLLRLPEAIDAARVEDVFDFSSATCTFGDHTLAIPELAGQPDRPDTARAPAPAAPVNVPNVASPAAGPPAAVAEAVAPEAVTPPGPAKPAAMNSAGSGATATIRVELSRLDRLINLVGELVITHTMLAQQIADGDPRSDDRMADLNQLMRELQETTMSIRAQPLQVIFNRMGRVVRDAADLTGKKVRLEISGEMTEVDKTVVERLADPLTHLIRNAVDHGMEPDADARQAAGKPAEGVVRIAADQRAGRVLITIADDGRGIDRERGLCQGGRARHHRCGDAADRRGNRSAYLRTGLFHGCIGLDAVGAGRRAGCGATQRPRTWRTNPYRQRARQRVDLHAQPAADAGRIGRHGRQRRGSDDDHSDRPGRREPASRRQRTALCRSPVVDS